MNSRTGCKTKAIKTPTTHQFEDINFVHSLLMVSLINIFLPHLDAQGVSQKKKKKLKPIIPVLHYKILGRNNMGQIVPE
jgi:hypothetical protein